MPYIKGEDRKKLAFRDNRHPENAGELNYLFTKLALQYIVDKGKKYQHYNDIIGALEGCKLELYRRSIVPYENMKIIENGDVE